MAEIIITRAACDLNRYLWIAMDRSTERNVRLAAEALASAILNGTPERLVRSEALEILLEEDEEQAIEALSRFFAGGAGQH
jgi:uncharacterized protein (UPF0147 family)